MKNVQNIVHKIFRFMAPKATFVMDQEKKTKRLATKSKTKAEKSKNVAHYLRIKCPICFENINKEAASSTKCGHVFCTTCLAKALRRMPICPTCRTKLKGPSGHHALYLDNNVCDEVDIQCEITTAGTIPAAAVDKVTALETANN